MKIMASGPITSWEIDGETVETVSDFSFLGSKITTDGDCSHEIKRRLLLGRKVMTNLDSIFKSRDITLPTKARLAKAMVFLWSCMDTRVGLWRRLSTKELMLLNCGAGEDSWESLGLQGNQTAAAAASKSLQSCPTLCDSIDGSPAGSPFPGILQARTLEWVAISFSNAWKWKVKVRSLSHVRLLATPWTAAHQAPLSTGFSRHKLAKTTKYLFNWKVMK